MTIRRLLMVGSDEFSTQAVDEASTALGLLVRHVPRGEDVDAALQGFGPDAVILDPRALDGPSNGTLGAVAASGAALLLLGHPEERGIRAARDQADAAGLPVAGILAKPVSPEGLEVAFRAMAGEVTFTAAEIAAAVMRGEMTAWHQLQLQRPESGWRADGAEALARWQHPQHGAVLPDAFVPVAEAEGQIAAITDCVLQSSVQQLAVWHRAGLPMRVGVNLSPALVETLARHPDRLVLGGEIRRLTFLFSDIRDFTSIAESMSPQDLTQFINRYLTPMTHTILDHGGTIDKYMGDAIMAFWNAPIDDPDHARHAANGALAMIRRLAELNAQWAEEARETGRPFKPVRIGVGLNTGEALVGNMGSDQRFDYSVLGDSVNLASRLEGQSKLYRVPIIAGEQTALAVPTGDNVNEPRNRRVHIVNIGS